MAYNDRDSSDVERANADAESLRNDLNRDDDETPPTWIGPGPSPYGNSMERYRAWKGSQA
jgi:hypothetical protein